jgi:predicted CXXCH cytochrome family protein
MKDKLARQKAHQPTDDCLTCHRPHAAAEKHLLSQPIGTLCDQCHEGKGKAFGEAHLGIDARRIRCATCHDPHASKDPKFFRSVQHAPFAARQCDSCHVTGKR